MAELFFPQLNRGSKYFSVAMPHQEPSGIFQCHQAWKTQ
jgi:hypothetical protein